MTDNSLKVGDKVYSQKLGEGIISMTEPDLDMVHERFRVDFGNCGYPVTGPCEVYYGYATFTRLPND